MESKRVKFRDLTQAEISAMSDEEFASIQPEEKRSCADCGWLTSAFNHYCTSPEAKAARGTSLPGCIKCPYWKARWLDRPIKRKNKNKKNGSKKFRNSVEENGEKSKSDGSNESKVSGKSSWKDRWFKRKQVKS